MSAWCRIVREGIPHFIEEDMHFFRCIVHINISSTGMLGCSVRITVRRFCSMLVGAAAAHTFYGATGQWPRRRPLLWMIIEEIRPGIIKVKIIRRFLPVLLLSQEFLDERVL